MTGIYKKQETYNMSGEAWNTRGAQETRIQRPLWLERSSQNPLPLQFDSDQCDATYN
jgi:hypothetical protein